jgi:hypothetical protein
VLIGLGVIAIVLLAVMISRGRKPPPPGAPPTAPPPGAPPTAPPPGAPPTAPPPAGGQPSV